MTIEPTNEPIWNLPDVHLNGTGGRELVEHQRRIILACQELIGALCAGSPHMRDYYTQPDGQQKFDEAAATCRAQVLLVTRMMTQAENSAIAIDAKDWRRR